MEIDSLARDRDKLQARVSELEKRFERSCAEMWDNPLIPISERIEIAQGAVKWRDELVKRLREEGARLSINAERYQILRDEKYQLHEDDPSVSDAFFNQFFGEELDDAVDVLKARYDSKTAKEIVCIKKTTRL